MTTIAILQARMSSSRLPGKVLLPLAGAPMVLRQLERIERATLLDEIVVATSTDPSDDELADVLEAAGRSVVRGDLNDVLARFVTVMDKYEPDVVVRLTADCPLASPEVIDRVVGAFRESGADYLSNTMTPSFPDGLDVEVVKASVLREVAQEATDQPEREHVTLGVYRRQERYRVENLANEVDYSHLRWTVDDPGDYAFVTQVYDSLFPENPHFDFDDVLGLLERHPELSRTEADAPRNAALQGLDTGAMNA